MGGGGSGVGFAAPELIGRGWLPGGPAVTVKKSSTFQLSPPYGGKPGGVRVLEIPLGKDRLVVEYRHEDPIYRDDDDGTLDAANEGVHAYRVPEGNYNGSRLVDPTEGKGDADVIMTLTDAAHQVEVKVVESGGGSATVAVALDGVPAPAKAGSRPTQHTSHPRPADPGCPGHAGARERHCRGRPRSGAVHTCPGCGRAHHEGRHPRPRPDRCYAPPQTRASTRLTTGITERAPAQWSHPWPAPPVAGRGLFTSGSSCWSKPRVRGELSDVAWEGVEPHPRASRVRPVGGGRTRSR
ncbi:hypothetical protein PV721_15285 [Streptomyces sp. MB09-01]|uniref:hypothetical protein n=1 Tax=Streptomyces sp. MB09-01 TaxID=3028666 RepID=UPI0029BF095D|nr:hypothetical protein [Streptomyces sp. MB09-01]MDX3535699.1 hypothetical protein [Streptomyces sp. MB09-01]